MQTKFHQASGSCWNAGILHFQFHIRLNTSPITDVIIDWLYRLSYHSPQLSMENDSCNYIILSLMGEWSIISLIPMAVSPLYPTYLATLHKYSDVNLFFNFFKRKNSPLSIILFLPDCNIDILNFIQFYWILIVIQILFVNFMN